MGCSVIANTSTARQARPIKIQTPLDMADSVPVMFPNPTAGVCRTRRKQYWVLRPAQQLLGGERRFLHHA